MPGSGRAGVEMAGTQVQLLYKDAPQALAGIEAMPGIALVPEQVGLECPLGQLEHPQVVLRAVMEAVRRIAALDDEPARAATERVAFLFEVHFAAARHGHQVERLMVLANVRLAARVAQRAGAQAGKAEWRAGRAPALQVAIEWLLAGKLQAQREIGFTDGFGPARLAFRLCPAVGRDFCGHGGSFFKEGSIEKRNCRQATQAALVIVQTARQRKAAGRLQAHDRRTPTV